MQMVTSTYTIVVFFNAACGQVIVCLLMIFHFHFIFGTSLAPVLTILTDILIKKIYSVTMLLGIYHTVVKFIIKLLVILFIIKHFPQQSISKSSFLCMQCKYNNSNMKLNGEIVTFQGDIRCNVFPNDTLNSISI